MATINKKRQLGRQVSIVGAGLSQFGAFANKDSRDLFVEAFQDMVKDMDRGFDIQDIECAYVGNYSSDLFEHQGHTAPIVADWLGITPIPITRIENACASSGSALREGVMAIASGMYDVVLVGGMEKMTNLPTDGVTDVLASAADGLYEVPAGLTFPGIFGAIAKAHMDKYETNLDHLLKVAIKNHRNGALNPKAQFQQTMTQMAERRMSRAQERGQTVPDYKTDLDFLNDEAANPWIAWPLRLYDCAPISDGASCVLLVSSDIDHNFTDTPIKIAGIGQASGKPLHDSEELTSLSAAKAASQQAYDMAGITVRDIDLAEVHDCFTITELIIYEDLGFSPRGKASEDVAAGTFSLEGELPVNTDGGLKCFGHPVGASGIRMIYEVYKQIQGTAGARQLPKADLGITHNLGGRPGSFTCSVAAFGVRD